MARSLALSPSTLSQVQSGKKHLSMDRAADVASRLGLDDQEIEYFCSLVQLESQSHPWNRSQIRKRLQRKRSTPPRKLKADFLKILSDWYYLPMLALPDREPDGLTEQTAAKAFGLSGPQARRALRRLERLGLLQQDSFGGWNRTFTSGIFESSDFHVGLRHFHRVMLKRAEGALSTQSPQERISLSETLALDPTDLPRAKEILERAQRELLGLLTRGTRKTEVYHLATHFFRVSEKES